MVLCDCVLRLTEPAIKLDELNVLVLGDDVRWAVGVWRRVAGWVGIVAVGGLDY